MSTKEKVEPSGNTAQVFQWYMYGLEDLNKLDNSTCELLQFVLRPGKTIHCCLLVLLIFLFTVTLLRNTQCVNPLFTVIQFLQFLADMYCNFVTMDTKWACIIIKNAYRDYSRLPDGFNGIFSIWFWSTYSNSWWLVCFTDYKWTTHEEKVDQNPSHFRQQKYSCFIPIRVHSTA